MSKLLQDLSTLMRVRRQAQDIFYEGMQAGYVNRTCLRTSIPQIAGSKHICFTAGEWTVTDTYAVSAFGDGSGGTTLISYDGVPIWMMQYAGWYPKEVIPTLKAALAKNYSTKAWCGGRGPRIYRHDGWTYLNTPEGAAPFAEFAGIERILDKGENVVGYHRYQGLFLIEK